jgi:hypothetical protein
MSKLDPYTQGYEDARAQIALCDIEGCGLIGDNSSPMPDGSRHYMCTTHMLEKIGASPLRTS